MTNANFNLDIDFLFVVIGHVTLHNLPLPLLEAIVFS
jgi:hypothetical protein